MAHDFKRFPELTDSQMNFYYFESPHKQIFDDFRAKVTKVKDGDTIMVSTSFRDFEFPIRLAFINTKEMSEGGGEAQTWLEKAVLGSEIDVKVDKANRVGKFGRLIGDIIHRGMSMSDELRGLMLAEDFARKGEGKIKDLEKELNQAKWFST